MRIKWIFSCFLAGMAMSANAKEFTAAQMDGVVQELGAKFGRSMIS